MCTAADCEKPATAKRLCHRHYQRWWKQSDKPAPSRFCEVDGCGRPYRAKGMCVTHYNRALPPERRYAKAAPGSARSKPGDPIDQPMGTWASKCCDGCGTWFLATVQKRRPVRWCSAACERRYNKTTRRARRVGAGGTYTERQFAGLVELLGGVCAYCSAPTERPEADHVVPLARGGSNDIANIAPACAGCNRAKHADTIDAWNVRRARYGLAPRRLDPRLAGRTL